MRTRRFWMLLAAAAVAGSAFSPAQERKAASTGPAVPDFGPVYDVPEPEFGTPLDRDFHAVFDVARSPAEPTRVNPSIETAARYLNMHRRAGVAPERLRAAVVLHGGAGKDALEDAAYRKRFGAPNPNRPLLERLESAGVRVILCGQTAGSRGFGREELYPSVELALSAMTALVVLQQDGYRLIAF